MTLCRHCNQPESAHHAFEARVELPPQCKCDPDSYSLGAYILPICERFVKGRHEPDYCDNCEHDEACHGRLQNAEHPMNNRPSGGWE